MRTLFLLFIIYFDLPQVQAQENYMTRNGQISFFSSTPLEDIKAVNNEVASVLNRKTGSVQFIVLIKSFQFRKAAMQDHFNGKDYMDSDRYPKAELKGTITNMSNVNFSKDGNYPVTVEGTLSMHGVSNKIKSAGNIIVKGNTITAAAVFIIKLVDYKISVPTIVSKKIAEKVEVSVNCNYQLYQPKTK
ncbi:YceI family protein [Lacibacter sediminis]|uniref:YceI family protein n=1 Tax=Lacibacter sediminis TaxID=2760713 RepID=A0A7G5XHV5_9BACT|nr:YceI family protein [Lacibacter sediminis]QNA45058.1 YceI family protein [Lacibacter sediminis]